jgi:hypothetical protein
MLCELGSLSDRHPLSDPEFALESTAARKQVQALWEACERIAAAPRVLDAIRSEAAQIGISFSKLKRLFYAWQKSGMDWETLVNRSRFPDPRESNHHPAFIAFLKNLYEEHQRAGTFEQTYRVLKAKLAAWERDPSNPALAIPGYSRPPKRGPITRAPAGWSKATLRNLISNKYERTLRRQGPKAASDLLPSIRTSRVGLEFGEILYFDDQQLDTYVNLTGRNARTMRPLAFNSLEALTGSCFAMGLKPQIWESETSSKLELNSLDFFWFVMHVLTQFGYNAKKGTRLVFEHGSANVDKKGNFDEDIKRITGGAVTVDRSGIWRAPAFKAMLFEGQPSGNFRFKAPLETWFNKLRNWHSALPGATGLDPDHAPEESHGLIAYNNRQLKLIDKVPTDLFLRLQRPVKEWEDFVQIANAINRAIDFDRCHSHEGWVKCGFSGQRYRLSLDTEQWISEEDYLRIPPKQRVALDHIVSRPGYFDSYQLAPGEAFAKLNAVGSPTKLTRLPIHCIPLLAPDRAWEDIAVNASLELTLVMPEIDSEPLRYIAKVRNSSGHEIILERGKTYKRLLNIFDPNTLWIAEADGARKGAFIGVATRLYVPCKNDHAAILTQLGEYNHVKSVESKEVETRMESEAAVRQRMATHNAALLAGRPVTPAEIAADRALAKKTNAVFTRSNTPTSTPKPEESNNQPEITADEYFSR